MAAGGGSSDKEKAAAPSPSPAMVASTAEVSDGEERHSHSDDALPVLRERSGGPSAFIRHSDEHPVPATASLPTATINGATKHGHHSVAAAASSHHHADHGHVAATSTTSSRLFGRDPPPDAPPRPSARAHSAASASAATTARPNGVFTGGKIRVRNHAKVANGVPSSSASGAMVAARERDNGEYHRLGVQAVMRMSPPQVLEAVTKFQSQRQAAEGGMEKVFSFWATDAEKDFDLEAVDRKVEERRKAGFANGKRRRH